MKLTITVIKNAKPKDKAYKLFDEAGLYLLITKKNHRFWRFNYKFAGKYEMLALAQICTLGFVRPKELSIDE